MDEAPEFSRPVLLDQIVERRRVMEISATEAERRALAERFGLVALDRFDATVRLSRSGPFCRIEADWEAEVIQTCVVTLEPIRNHLSESLSERYGPPEEAGMELDLDPEGDTPEPIEGGSLDIGEALAQALSLSLDPFPRKPGVAVEIPAEEEAPTGPFAALAKLKKSP